MNPLLEAAIHYSEIRKWSVIPLSPGSKIPPKGFSVIPFRERIATRQEIESWWKENPNYNVGVITGKLSNLFVIDHDKHKPEYSEDEALKYIPDDIMTPTCTTPNGGEHQYFLFTGAEGITIKAGFAPAMDYRGEGGYVVAPPSVNGNGKSYQWIDGLKADDVETAALEVSFINKITNYIYGNVTRPENTLAHVVTDVTKRYIWEDGKRDDNLYYVSQCLKDCGAENDYITQVLRAIIASWGEVNERWIESKIKSATDRLARKDRNWQEDVDRFIAVTDGSFSVTECYHALLAVTKLDKGAVRIALNRRKDKTIQKVGSKDGVYSKLDQNIEFMTFDDKKEVAYPVTLPMSLDSLVEISSGNIILVAGEYNSGKTTFLLNVLCDNKNKMPIRYLSSEMESSEFKKRFRGFGMPLDFWKPDEMTDYVKLKKNNDYHHCLKPDGLNIIDYLEFRDSDYTLGAEIMRQIHDALGGGICIVGIQKKEGTRLPRSGDLVLEKPRLALSLTKHPGERELIIAEILKGKMPRMGKCDGKKAMYEIKDLGSRFREERAWGYWK
jgi:hypothetical protein